MVRSPQDCGDIKSQFDASFTHWKIRLPARALKSRRPGRILKAGWAISYTFGCDEQGEYLDFYSSHRMTNDHHVRLRDGVRPESLPAIACGRIVSPDPEEDARRDAEYVARNRSIARMLDEKGFGMTGDEPGSVLINRFLRLGGADENGGGGNGEDKNGDE